MALAYLSSCMFLDLEQASRLVHASRTTELENRHLADNIFNPWSLQGSLYTRTQAPTRYASVDVGLYSNCTLLEAAIAPFDAA